MNRLCADSRRGFIFKLGSIRFLGGWIKMRLNLAQLEFDDDWVFDTQSVRNIFHQRNARRNIGIIRFAISNIIFDMFVLR